MKRENVKGALINSAIDVIATQGLDKATTKLIANVAKLNEVYIYRNFIDKEDLFVKVFEFLDDELVDAIACSLPVMMKDQFTIEDRCKTLFASVWKFLIGNENKCRSYISYYYSPYYNKYSAIRHDEIYKDIVEICSSAFIDGTDVLTALNCVLDIMLALAVKVFNGKLVNNEETAKVAYDFVYSAVRSKLIWEVEKQQ